MEGIAGHISLLSSFALAIGLAILLPRAGERLLDESYVNAVLVLVVVTCVAGPILAERYAKQVKPTSESDAAVKNSESKSATLPAS